MAGAGAGVGLAALKRGEQATARTQELSEQLASDRAAHIAEQVALFRRRLEEFALQHRAEINRDPVFRQSFIRMAKSIGVDPLSSTKSGGWLAETSGIGLSSFYADLGVQVAHVCVAARPVNGGLISMQELLARLTTLRGSRAGGVGEEDVRRALAKLAVLGGGYTELTVGRARYISSVPELLTNDTSTVLAAAAAASGRFLTAASLSQATGWPGERAGRALTRLLPSGLAWIDAAPPQPAYYFPTLFFAGTA